MQMRRFSSYFQATQAVCLLSVLHTPGLHAQDAENALVIEEVVVTAQKREESVQDILLP